MDKLNNSGVYSQDGRNNMVNSKSVVSHENKLKQMKKFYPEEYFRRSGYNFAGFAKKKNMRNNDLVYFKK